MKRVLIYGWFGENNVGDELLLKTMLELLSNNSEIEPYVICSNPMQVKQNHHVKTASIAINGSMRKYIKASVKSPFSLIKCLFETEAMIVAGGGAISDWNYTSTREMFYLINWFKKRNKPIYLLGIGAGPITKEKPGGRFSKILDKANLITVRDEFSLKELRKLDLKNVKLSNDLVTYSSLYDKNSLPANNIKKIGLVVVPVCMNSEEIFGTLKKELELLITLLNKEYEVNIIPFQINYDMEFINDLVFDKTCVNILKPNTLWDPLDFIKQQDCIVGMRYHSLVLSILMKKYFIPIIYHPKSAELCKEYGIEDYAVSVGNGENWIKSNISAIDIRNKIKRLEKDKNFIDHNLEVLAQKRKCNIEKEIIRNL